MVTKKTELPSTSVRMPDASLTSPVLPGVDEYSVFLLCGSLRALHYLQNSYHNSPMHRMLPKAEHIQ